MPIIRPLLRAFMQLDDPRFVAVALRGVAGAAGLLIGLAIAIGWGMRHVLPAGGMFGWLAGLLGGAGAMVAAIWFYVPLAGALAALMLETVARAVEDRFYPDLPPPRGTGWLGQAADAAVLGGQLLLLSLLTLGLAVLLPGIGWIAGWAVAAWGLGRGLFVAVAMRRLPRPGALALYRRQRGRVVALGAMLVCLGYLPLFGLLLPVIGTACMVHVLQAGRAASPRLRVHGPPV